MGKSKHRAPLYQAILAAAPSLIHELVPLLLDTLPLVSAVLKAPVGTIGLGSKPLSTQPLSLSCCGFRHNDSDNVVLSYENEPTVGGLGWRWPGCILCRVRDGTLSGE